MLPDNRRRVKSTDVCFFCGKMGHWQNECPDRQPPKCEYDISDLSHVSPLLLSDDYTTYISDYFSVDNVFYMSHPDTPNYSYTTDVNSVHGASSRFHYCSCLSSQTVNTTNSVLPSNSFKLTPVDTFQSLSVPPVTTVWTKDYDIYESTDANISVVGRLRAGIPFMKSIGFVQIIFYR